MRAAVLHAQRPIDERPIRLEERPVPEPGPGEVRLRVLACGVCHTDLHVVEGDLPVRRLPVVPGHQIVGVIDHVGPGGDPAMLGRRVGVTWLASTDGVCDACRRGDENLCPNAQFTGYDRDGGYAECAVARAGFVTRLPESFDDLQAAPLLCAGVIGYRALRVAGVQHGESIGLYGFGASAHLAMQVATSLGCDVAVVTRGAAHRALAEALGARWVGGLGSRPPRPLDRAIVFAPAGLVVREALEAVRPGGTVAINAVSMDGLPAMPYGVLYGERVLRTVSNLTRADAAEFLGVAGRIRLRIEYEAFPLEQANDVLQQLKRRTLRAAAVLQVTSST